MKQYSSSFSGRHTAIVSDHSYRNNTNNQYHLWISRFHFIATNMPFSNFQTLETGAAEQQRAESQSDSQCSDPICKRGVSVLLASVVRLTPRLHFYPSVNSCLPRAYHTPYSSSQERRGSLYAPILYLVADWVFDRCSFALNRPRMPSGGTHSDRSMVIHSFIAKHELYCPKGSRCTLQIRDSKDISFEFSVVKISKRVARESVH